VAAIARPASASPTEVEAFHTGADCFALVAPHAITREVKFRSKVMFLFDPWGHRSSAVPPPDCA
jgi:hypothetical protein